MSWSVDLLAAGSGALVGLVLGLVGGGGSILAVPLLVYVVGLASPHIAIGTAAVAVSASALVNLAAHHQAGNVRWPCAAVFAGAGVLGALAGAAAARTVDGQKLLALFGLLMIAVGLMMMRRKTGGGDPAVRLTTATVPKLLPLLLVMGSTVGLLSGFFGIGGGFLIVPGLMVATGMPLTLAVGTSLVAVSAFGAATAASYAASGLVDWPIAAMFIAGGFLGGLSGVRLAKLLAAERRVLGLVFSAIVIVVGLYVTTRGLAALS
jgi:uncharacterized membrane protein YfcA